MYVEDWRRKVERVGNLNYPDNARGRVYGSLRVTVSIKPDGSIEEIQVDRPSEHKILNEAALKSGAFDYIAKPIKLEQLRPLVMSALKLPKPPIARRASIGEVPPSAAPRLIGESAAMHKAREMIGTLDPAATVQNGAATVTYLEGNALTNGKAGAIGFCWG